MLNYLKKVPSPAQSLRDRSTSPTRGEVILNDEETLSPCGRGWPVGPGEGALETIGDYWSLLKPRVMILVVFTGIVGLFLAPGVIHPFVAFVAIFSIALGSGAAGAINMWYERDIDALMDRTKGRPLPQGKIQPNAALVYGVSLAVVSILLMYIFVNFWAAFYLMVAILTYVFIYTLWLKRRTPQNIVIGGAAGALPPVIGWAAVMNETSVFPWILFGIIFLWTPPHFWSLALYRHQDYEKAKIPMLPLVVGIKKTKDQILIYSFLLFFLTFLPCYRGDLGFFYGISATLLGLIFLTFVFKLKFSENPKDGLRVFFYSISYLFSLFSAMLIDIGEIL